jgi:hypothetical protein
VHKWVARDGDQATDQNNISRIVSWEIDNGARHREPRGEAAQVLE